MLHLLLLPNHPVTSTPVWGFSFLSVTVVNVFSLTGVFIVPLVKTRYMKYALIFFIALAIGTLYSTAILQLLPEVCHLSIHPSIYTSFHISQTLKLKTSSTPCSVTWLLTRIVHLWPSAPLPLLWLFLYLHSCLCFHSVVSPLGSNKICGRLLVMLYLPCIADYLVLCLCMCLLYVWICVCTFRSIEI